MGIYVQLWPKYKIYQWEERSVKNVKKQIQI